MKGVHRSEPALALAPAQVAESQFIMRNSRDRRIQFNPTVMYFLCSIGAFIGTLVMLLLLDSDKPGKLYPQVWGHVSAFSQQPYNKVGY